MPYSPNVDYRAVARRKALKYGLNPHIFERQIGVESVGYSPAVISGRTASPAGAQGIAQFMPATARGLGVNPLHPKQALDAAARLMAGYVRKYGSYRSALIAYNAGPGRVGSSSLPGETQRYIANILHGHDPGHLGSPRAGVQSSGGRSGVTITQHPGSGSGGQGLTVGAPDMSALSALLAQQSQPQAPVTTPLAAPSFSGQSYLKTSAMGLPPTQQPVPQDTGLAAKLAAIGSMAGDTTLGGKTAKPGSITIKGSVQATGQPGTSPSVAVPGSGPDAVRTLIERANRIDSHHYNYEWGGGHNTGNHPSHGYGHGSGPGIGFDCSGAVSRVLGINPRVAAQFESFGQAGRGKHVTIYANGSHTFLEINGKFFGTSGHNPGGGARWYNWHPDPAYLRGFVARHPRGM